METLKEIIRQNRMSTRPEFYSGRGATLSDLDSKILEGIHQGIKNKFGKEPAENFVKMVTGIKVISATTFLNDLYSLFYNDWKYTPKENDESGIEVGKDKDGNYDLVNGMVGMFEAMSNRRDDTASIKGSFLMKHGVNLGVANGMYETSSDGTITRYFY